MRQRVVAKIALKIKKIQKGKDEQKKVTHTNNFATISIFSNKWINKGRNFQKEMVKKCVIESRSEQLLDF